MCTEQLEGDNVSDQPKRSRATAGAEKEVLRLAALERSVTARLDLRNDEIASAEAALDAAMLRNELADDESAAVDVTPSAERIATLRAETAATSRLVDTLRAQRAEAIRTVWSARAGDLRADASRLRDKAEKEAQWLAQALAPIEARAGVPLGPQPSWPQQSGTRSADGAELPDDERRSVAPGRRGA